MVPYDAPGVAAQLMAQFAAPTGLSPPAQQKERKARFSNELRAAPEFQCSLGVRVDTDEIEAQFKNGVLTITLPKAAEAQRREEECDQESMIAAPIGGQSTASRTTQMSGSSGSDAMWKPSSLHIAIMAVFSLSTCPSMVLRPSARAYSMIICMSR